MSEAIAPPETRTKEAEQLADRYLALWNEPDPERRRRMIAELWTEDGSQIYEQWVGSGELQLQAARRRRAAARRGQVPLGGHLAGRRGDGGGSRLSRPRRGRRDSTRLRVHRELGATDTTSGGA